VLVVAQIALGVATVVTLRSVPLAVGHFAGAASLWALWMSAWLLTGVRAPAAARVAPDVHALQLVRA
jgi:heme A synthase